MERWFKLSPKANGYLRTKPSLRELLHPLYFSERILQALIEIDDRDAIDVPLGLLEDLFVHPDGIVRQKAAKITTPIYAAFGEIDMTSRPHDEEQFYSNSASFTLAFFPDCHHCVNFEPARYDLWNKIALWSHAMRSSPME
jgi:pimeloyl-ACP methyl ester carboxylesterase